jgi:hypothetical protein
MLSDEEVDLSVYVLLCQTHALARHVLKLFVESMRVLENAVPKLFCRFTAVTKINLSSDKVQER